MKDYAITIVLWGYEKPRKLMKVGDTPVYFTYECNITNIELLLKEIISKGLLKNPTNIEMLQILTINELKEILKSYDLPVSGKKDNLIDRIIENNLALDLLNEREYYYILSDLGNEFLNSHYDYIELHRNQVYGVYPKEYFEVKKRLLKQYNSCNFSDCIWNVFQERLFRYSKNRDYLQLYFTYEHMADLTNKEGQSNVAVNFYLKCVIYELCGVFFYNEYIMFKDDPNLGEVLKDSIMMGDNYNRNYISLIECKDFFSFDMIEREYNHLEMNFKLCSLELIKQLLSKAMNDPMFTIEDYKETLVKERLKELKKYL